MSHKMDQHLIALEQPHEIAHIRNKYKIRASVLRAVVEELKTITGKKRVVSRDDIMIRLFQLGLIKPKIEGPVIPAEWFEQNNLKHETQD